MTRRSRAGHTPGLTTLYTLRAILNTDTPGSSVDVMTKKSWLRRKSTFFTEIMETGTTSPRALRKIWRLAATVFIFYGKNVD